MTFKDSVRTCLGKYAAFSGRASRSEYWWFQLFIWFSVAVLFGLGIGLTRLFGMDQGPQADQTQRIDTLLVFPAILPGLFFLGMFLPNLSAQVRRFHDRGISGWWVLALAVAGAVPYVGWLISLAGLVITIMKGNPGTNRFGPDPLVAQHGADVFA